MARRKIKLLKPLILILLILGILVYLKYDMAVTNPVDSNDTTTISFQVKRGATVREIATNLKEKDLINSPLSFYIYTRINKLDEKILAGRFLLSKSMNIPEILSSISDPSQAEFVITIQEGLTIKDIDQKLVDLELIESGAFLSAVRQFNNWHYYPFLDSETLKKLDLPLEGYLYPDTYFLEPNGFEPQDLIFLCLDNFESKIENLQTGDKTLHDIVTMASIIENEVFGAKDRKIVSGILWKRLENGWPLGADATIIYITPDRHIDAADLAIDSPYNTRKNTGLTPGPISNPSLESLEAAANPQDSDFWFYLTTPNTGEVIYSKSNEEHNVNRAKYL